MPPDDFLHGRGRGLEDVVLHQQARGRQANGLPPAMCRAASTRSKNRDAASMVNVHASPSLATQLCIIASTSAAFFGSRGDTRSGRRTAGRWESRPFPSGSGSIRCPGSRLPRLCGRALRNTRCCKRWTCCSARRPARGSDRLSPSASSARRASRAGDAGEFAAAAVAQALAIGDHCERSRAGSFRRALASHRRRRWPIERCNSSAPPNAAVDRLRRQLCSGSTYVSGIPSRVTHVQPQQPRAVAVVATPGATARLPRAGSCAPLSGTTGTSASTRAISCPAVASARRAVMRSS